MILRQQLREIRLRPTEQQTIDLAYGSELDITCFTDKPLREVQLIPRNPEFPGIGSKEELQPVRLKVNPDGNSFTVRFASSGKPVREWLAHEWYGSLPTFLRPDGFSANKRQSRFPDRHADVRFRARVQRYRQHVVVAIHQDQAG